MGGISPPVAGDQLLVGREAERSRIEAFVAAVPEGARALVLRGEPGIGKTTLWRHAVDRCRAESYRALVTRPAEEEMPVAFLGLSDLFEGVVLEVDPSSLREGDPYLPGRATLDALRVLAESGPVVIAIDDLQWLDSVSARALRFALRRLDREPVAVLAAARPDRQARDPLDSARTLAADRVETIELEPLGVEDLRKVLAGVVSSISRPMLRRIHEISGGNPFYAIQIARGVRASGSPRSTEDPSLPDSIHGAIADRLDTVPPELIPVLQTVSAMGPTSVTALRGAVDATQFDALLDAAEQQSLLVVEPDLEVRFSHPLLASAVHARMSTLARRSLHARLADRASEPDDRARHLALSAEEPDAAVAGLLEDASARAGARGAFDVAAEFDRHSIRLTPAADAEAGQRRAVAEIVHLAAAGEPKRALALADEMIGALPPGPARTQAIVERVYLDLGAGESVLLQALDVTRDDLLRGRLLDLLGWMRGIIRGDLRGGMACAREAATIAERTGDAELEMLAESSIAVIEAMAGDPRPERMARALELAEGIGGPPLARRPRIFLARLSLWAGDLAEAQALFERAFDEFVRSGTEFQRPYRLCDLALVHCAAGDFARAEELVAQGTEAALDAENTEAERWLLYPKALVDAWFGRAAAARATAGRLAKGAKQRGERLGIVRANAVLGLLALSEGEFGVAARELTEVADVLDELGIEHPGVFPVLPDAIEALARLGDDDGARALLERLRRQAASVRTPLAAAVADRSEGMVLLARGDADGAADLLAAATDGFDRLGHRPDAARALLGRGRALLRGGHRNLAADALAEARGRFAAMGAARWERLATAELERAAAGRAAGELTPAERRVAGLVAQGMKNRQIGQTLFMSIATVEAHLTRIYRKLGIGSRSELTRLVADGRVSVAPTSEAEPAAPPVAGGSI